MIEATSESLAVQLDSLLSEGSKRALMRERCAFDEAAAPNGSRIVLFGAGRVGRRTLAGLRKHRVEPIAFADNNRALWGSQVDGIPVLSPREAASEHGKSAVFVITVWGGKKPNVGEDRMCDRVRELSSLGCRNVTTFGTLYWKYSDGLLPYYGADLPHKVHEDATQIRAAFNLWADEASRIEYVSEVRWRLFLDFDGLPRPVSDTMYFPKDLFMLSPDEVFIDCGAYDGDTLDVFLKESGGRFGKFVALEPDPENFARMQEYHSETLRLDPRVTAFQVASGARTERLSFIADGSDAARVASINEENVVEVDSVKIDDFLGDLHPTFVKMDIEGSERDALRGAERTIREDSPILAICAYHKQDDLWKIPLLIKSFNPKYRFFLRPHKLEGWDLVCYAIPEGRIVRTEDS